MALFRGILHARLRNRQKQLISCKNCEFAIFHWGFSAKKMFQSGLVDAGMIFRNFPKNGACIGAVLRYAGKLRKLYQRRLMSGPSINQGLAPCTTCPIHRWSIFSGLSVADLQHLPMAVYDLNISEGTVLSQEGLPNQRAFVVRQGVVKLERAGPDGMHLVQLLRSGDIWGFEGLDQRQYQHTATALEAAHICCLEVEVLQQWCERDARVRQAIRRRLQQAHQETEEHLLLLLSSSAELRVVGFLSRWCRDYPDGQKISLPLSRQELANYLGMSKEHLSRIMAKLKRQGLLREQHGWIQVDYQRLRAINADSLQARHDEKE